MCDDDNIQRAQSGNRPAFEPLGEAVWRVEQLIRKGSVDLGRY